MAGSALPQLRTERLRLRERTEVDLPALIDMEDEPQVVRFMSDGKPRNEEQKREELRRKIHRKFGEEFGYWSVFAATDPYRFLGWVCLRPLLGYPEIELGYCFAPEARGHGYATEAGQACLGYAFNTLGLDEVVAVIHPENRRSQSVIARLGFTQHGERLAYERQLGFYRLKRAPV
jgi:RimJ/RimL family protein N-acetyltransferase